MKKNRNRSSRLISLLLVFMMIFTMMPAMAWAGETGSNIEIETGHTAGVGRIDKVTITSVTGSYEKVSKGVWNVNLDSFSGDSIDVEVILSTSLNSKISLRISDADSGDKLLSKEVTAKNVESLGNKQYKYTYTITPKWKGTQASVYFVPLNGTSELGTYSARLNLTRTAGGNAVPYLKTGIAEESEETIVTGRTYGIDLEEVFEDAEGDSLDFYYQVGEGEFVELESSLFTYTVTEPSDSVVTLKFKASDGQGESPVKTVSLNVQTNLIPRIKDGVAKTESVIIKKGHTYSLDLDNIFEELNESDTISYYVKYSGEDDFVQVENAEFSYIPEEVKLDILVFKAYDSEAFSEEYTVNLDVVTNRAPVLKGESEFKKTIIQNSGYSINLTDIFEDEDNEPLTYSVSINGEEATLIDGNVYTFSTEELGENTYVFTADDGMDIATYKVVLTVAEAGSKIELNVNVPNNVSVTFYETAGFNSDNEDIIGTQLVVTETSESETGTSYVVMIPVTAEYISIRTENMGGHAVPVTEGETVNLQKVQLMPVDFAGETVEGTIQVISTGHKVLSGADNLYLLEKNQNYTYTVKPTDTDVYAETKGDIVLPGKESEETINISTELKNQKTVTVTTGAEVKLYQYKNNYYVYDIILPIGSVVNSDGTTTFYFAANGKLTYRVSITDKITKAGYFTDKNIIVLHTDEDLLPDSRPEYSETAYDNKSIAEDSVLVNVNKHNNLVMAVDESKILKAYRTWEIIMYDYENQIIQPDMKYTILSGNDVVSLTDTDAHINGNGSWKKITALKEGSAIIEVSYDAIEVSGGSYSGVYGASDPSRTGLIVVQVGESNHADVDFGIDGYSAIGAAGASNLTDVEWDAEMDTLYFTEDSGCLSFTPSVDGGIVQMVEVSNDKGITWTSLTAIDEKYTATIVPGNNILKVTTDLGVAYQVVRGDKITIKLTEVRGESDGDGIVEAEETIRITFNGLHMPIPKISGNYNPMSTQLNYVSEGISFTVPSSQYDFINTSNYIEFKVPSDKESLLLSNGKILIGMIGLGSFTNDSGNSHRNIPDEGCATRGNGGTQNVRSVLPELTIYVGQETSPNTPPKVKSGAVDSAQIKLGQNYALNPETLFEDEDGDKLSFQVSINEGEAQDTTSAFIYTPEETGTHTLKFVASDGKLTAEHTVTLNVIEDTGSNTDKELKFDISGSQIAGYVYISFEDNATRKEGETGLKYPTPLGTIIKATKVPFREGDSIAQVTVRLLDALGIGYTNTGTVSSNFYLASIKNFVVNNTPYDEMGQYDAGSGSGWMITQNSVFIDKGTSYFKVNNNDVIAWQYTCQLGRDIGDTRWEEEKKDEEVKDVTTSGGAAGGAGTAGSTEPVTTTTPTEVKVVGTTATATITKENVTETIKQATESKSAEIVVQVSASDTKGAANVKVQLDTTTVKDVVNKTEAALTVKTENGTVTLDRETLKTVAAEAAGSAVTLEVIEVAAPTAAHKEAAGENAHVIQLVIKSGNKTISLFNEGKATVTVAIPTKLDGKKVAAIHIADDGKVEHLKGEEVAVNGKKHYRFDTPHFSTFALVDADEIGLEVEETPAMTAEEVKALIADLTPVARSAKVKKGIKVTLKLDKSDKAIVEALEDAGYTVKYNFYRSTKKSSKYSSKTVKTGKTYTNTAGKNGTKYYYKARVQVYDAESKLIARTTLKQCKYASRTWK